jgi:integrase
VKAGQPARLISIPEEVTKNGDPLVVPIDPELLQMLKKQFRREGPVFDTTNFRKAFNAAAVTVGLGKMTGENVWEYEGITPHGLRRSAARNCVRAGNSETVAMKIGGWKTPSVFRRYNITSVEDVKQGGKRIASYNASSMQVGRTRSK